jgi:hypothetical protein
MSKKFFLRIVSILITILILSFTIYAFGITAEEMLKNPNLTDSERSTIARVMAQTSESSIPMQMKGLLEWKEMGEAFATTIKQICQTLNVEVNAFLQSDVGKLTAAVIIYRMVGKDLIRIGLYTLIWLGITFCIGLSIKILHMKKKITKTIYNEEQKTKTETTDYVERFEWPDDDIKTGSLIAHIIVWFAFSCIIVGNII